MNKRIMFGLLAVGAIGLAYYFFVGSASAEDLYVKNLSDFDLQGLIAAGFAGTGYANLSADDVQKLLPAAQKEQALRMSPGYQRPEREATIKEATLAVASPAAQAAVARAAKSKVGFKVNPLVRFNKP